MAPTESSSVARGGRRVTEPGQRDATPTDVWLRGEYDVASVPALAEVLASAIAADDADVVVHLDKVQFMDASTIGVLVRAAEFLGRRSRSLWLRSPSSMARRLLEICGLTDLLDPSSVDVISVAGAADSLSTWVAVPASDRVDPTVDEPRPNAHTPEAPERRPRVAAAPTGWSGDTHDEAAEPETNAAGRQGA